MFTKAQLKTALLAVLVVAGLNQIDATRDLISGKKSFF